MRARGCAGRSVGTGVRAPVRGAKRWHGCAGTGVSAKRWRKIRAGATGRGGAEASQDTGRKFFAKWAEKDDSP